LPQVSFSAATSSSLPQRNLLYRNFNFPPAAPPFLPRRKLTLPQRHLLYRNVTFSAAASPSLPQRRLLCRISTLLCGRELFFGPPQACLRQFAGICRNLVLSLPQEIAATLDPRRLPYRGLRRLIDVDLISKENGT
jgi:hypothetical protein